MSLLRTIIFGREKGIRSTLRSMLGERGTSAPDWTPDSAYSAPSYDSPVGSEGSSRPEPPRGVTPPEGFEVVLHVDALKPGEVGEFIAGGTAICVANVDGQFYSISNTCPPGDGPLGEGKLEGKLVICPYHGWAFDVTTGECKTNPSAAVETYEVEIKEDAVCVRL